MLQSEREEHNDPRAWESSSSRARFGTISTIAWRWSVSCVVMHRNGALRNAGVQDFPADPFWTAMPALIPRPALRGLAFGSWLAVVLGCTTYEFQAAGVGGGSGTSGSGGSTSSPSGGGGSSSSGAAGSGALGLGGNSGSAGSGNVGTGVAVSEPAPPGENLALRGSACASNEQGGAKLIPYAIDGNPSSMWCPVDGATGYYYGVDLGDSYVLSGVRLLWEFYDRVYQYQIEISADGRGWQLWIDEAANTLTGPVVHARSGEARYVRIVWRGLQPPNATWSCVSELQIWGLPLDASAPPSISDAAADAERADATTDASARDAATPATRATCAEIVTPRR